MKKTISLAILGLAVCSQIQMVLAADLKYKISSVAGKIVHFNRSSGILHLQMERGNTWIIQMQPDAKYEKFKQNANASSFKEGEMVSVGLSGSLTETPKKAVLMVDWGNSADYVAKNATAPYTTRMGDFQSVGGAATKPPVGAQQSDNTIGVLGHGGQVNHSINNSNGGVQSVTSGNSTNLPDNLTKMTNTRGTWMQPMENMGINPYAPMGSAGSLMNNDEENGAQSGGVMGGGPPQATAGNTAQINAVIVQANAAGHTLVVRQQGTNSNMNVMVDPRVNLSMLRPGQNVMIMGAPTPGGYIEASQVVPLGQ